jgi:hypothetical protein
MRQRGRKGSAELEVASAIAVVRRPNPVLDLTPEESDVWVQTVEAMPADWFRAETFPLLAQFCRHTVSARRVSQLIDAAMSREEVSVGELKELLTMQRGETAALKAMASAMRLSQQSSYSDKGAAGRKAERAPIKRPWE